MTRPVRPPATSTVDEDVRAYLIALEVYATMLEARAWAVAGELRYEQENRAEPLFGALADELTGETREGPGAP